MPKLRPPALSTRHLPANVTDLQSQRIVSRTITLLDEVEQALLALYDEPEFRRYRDALDNDETVEGSVFVDDICAAQIIRKKGEVLGLHQIEEANLSLLSQKLRAAERRFNASRKQRKTAPPDSTPPTEAVAATA